MIRQYVNQSDGVCVPGRSCDKTRYNIRPSCSRDAHKVYIDTATVPLSQSHVRVLNLCQIPKKMLELPSSVLDWTQKLKMHMSVPPSWPFPLYSHYLASQGMPPEIGLCPATQFPQIVSLAAILLESMSVILREPSGVWRRSQVQANQRAQ